MKFPKASDLKVITAKKKVQEAKRKFNPAVKKVLDAFKQHVELVKAGEKKNDYFIMPVPIEGYEENFVPLLAGVGSVLTPLGYSIKISHDGGGMYNTIVIGWA